MRHHHRRPLGARPVPLLLTLLLAGALLSSLLGNTRAALLGRIPVSWTGFPLTTSPSGWGAPSSLATGIMQHKGCRLSRAAFWSKVLLSAAAMLPDMDAFETVGQSNIDSLRFCWRG